MADFKDSGLTAPGLTAEQRATLERLATATDLEMHANGRGALRAALTTLRAQAAALATAKKEAADLGEAFAKLSSLPHRVLLREVTVKLAAVEAEASDLRAKLATAEAEQARHLQGVREITECIGAERLEADKVIGDLRAKLYEGEARKPTPDSFIDWDDVNRVASRPAALKADAVGEARAVLHKACCGPACPMHTGGLCDLFALRAEKAAHAGVCSSGFHLCRKCAWRDGVCVKSCGRHEAQPDAVGEAPTAYDYIREERATQARQWGGPAHDDAHNCADWLGYIAKQLRLADREVPEGWPAFRSRMVKVAALAVAAIESGGRKAAERAAGAK